MLRITARWAGGLVDELGSSDDRESGLLRVMSGHLENGLGLTSVFFARQVPREIYFHNFDYFTESTPD